MDDQRRNFLRVCGTFLIGLMTSCLKIGTPKGEASMTNEKKLKMVLGPKEQHWVGDGFHVHTLVSPSPELYPSITPFLLMDYAPPSEFKPTSKKLGVGEHPHRGFETVTFAINGEVEHRDSAGGGGIIGTGDVQWMTAASGLVHEEFHSKEFAKTGGTFEMVQLWVNLPANKKMTPPRYQGVKNEQFPRVQLGEQTTVQVVAGKCLEKVGPCNTYTDINVFLVDNKLKDSIVLNFKEGTNSLVLVLRGKVFNEQKPLTEKSLLIYEREGESIKLDLEENTKLLVLNGDPIDEPIATYGPFVMNTREELMQAVEDYQSGKMGYL